MKTGMNETVKSINSEGTKLDVIAMIMNTQKSSVCKLQKKTVGEVQLAKLKQFVEASGGNFEATITLANGDTITI